MKRICMLGITLMLVSILLLGAYVQTASAAGNAEKSAETVAAETAEETAEFTERELDQSYDAAKAVSIALKGDSAESSSAAVVMDGSNVCITDEGVYVITGTLKDGSLIVDAEKSDKVELVLDNASVTSANFAALYVRQADKVFVTLAAGSKNELVNGGRFVLIDDSNVDGAVFSKDDLVLKGSGSLTIASPAGHGVVCKDELVITGGSYEITALKHGLQSKESIAVCDAELAIEAGKDGIHAEDSDADNVGDVYIESGKIIITAASDAVSAGNIVTVTGGSLNLSSGKTEDVKGIKGGNGVDIQDGTIQISVTDDAIHSNGDLEISGGTITIQSGDDALHADGGVLVNGGTLNVTESHEGIEGQTIEISGGELHITADDDALNASGGSSGASPWGRGGFEVNENCAILISGGKLYVNTRGDGVDSNGGLVVTGGEVYVSGPTSGGNGSLDYNGSGSISGGIFAAAGNSQMAMNFGSSSTQCAMLVTVGSQKAGTEIAVTDQSGKKLFSWAPESDYQCVVLSLPEFQQGETYTVTAGSSSTTVRFDSVIYGATSGMGGMGGMRPDGGGMQPGMEGGMPDNGGMQPGGGFGGHGGMGGRPGGRG